MPLSVYRRLGMGEARSTTITIQLADCSITHPEGKINDVLVQVDKFIHPANFIILNFDADKYVPIILGRPFLTIGRALIDVHKGEVTMRVQDQEIKFSVYDSMKYFLEAEECSILRVLDEALIETLSSKVMLEHPDVDKGNMLEQANENCQKVIYLILIKKLTQ